MSSNQPTWIQRVLFALGTVATIVAFVLQVLGISGSFTGSSVLFLLCIVSFACLIAYDPTRKRLRFFVLRACQRAKREAGRSIDIAAGDCSWLKRELTIIEERASKGVRVRLLCEPSLADFPCDSLGQLVQMENVEVRSLPADLQMYLRCIIVDRDREQHQMLLLLDKPPTAQRLFRLMPIPEALRTDHEVTYVDPRNRLFRLMCLVFDGAFEKGTHIPVNDGQVRRRP